MPLTKFGIVRFFNFVSNLVGIKKHLTVLIIYIY